MIFLYSDEEHFAGLSSLLRNSFQLYPISSPPKLAKSQTWLPYLEEQAEVEKIRSKIKCLVCSAVFLEKDPATRSADSEKAKSALLSV